MRYNFRFLSRALCTNIEHRHICLSIHEQNDLFTSFIHSFACSQCITKSNWSNRAGVIRNASHESCVQKLKHWKEIVSEKPNMKWENTLKFPHRIASHRALLLLFSNRCRTRYIVCFHYRKWQRFRMINANALTGLLYTYTYIRTCKIWVEKNKMEKCLHSAQHSHTIRAIQNTEKLWWQETIYY